MNVKIAKLLLLRIKTFFINLEKYDKDYKKMRKEDRLRSYYLQS